MPKLLEECGPEEYALLDGLIRRHRDDLTECRARILLLFAADEKGGPALKHHGHAVLGKAQVHGYRDRVQGKPDATITLDRLKWRELPDRRRLALLHHELSHIGWRRGQFDALGRPRLHVAPGDFENDGFFLVCRIYGTDAPERRWLDSVRALLREQELPEAGEETPPAA